jgi:hypothetical protein
MRVTAQLSLYVYSTTAFNKIVRRLALFFSTPTPTDKRRKMEIFFKKEEGTISIFL